MNHISVLIVDDDLNKISSVIASIRESNQEIISYTQASSVQEAIETLQKKEFHLLISDLKLPLKPDDVIPSDEGGQALVRSLYRKKTRANVPMYIVGLTQFKNLQIDFKGVWKVWYFDKSLNDWRDCLRDLIFHISLVKSRISVEKIETLFVEGISDQRIIATGLKKYYPTYEKLIYVDSMDSGGGASWVERQLLIWAKSLNKKNGSEDYLKAIGLFDDDRDGKASINNLRQLVDVNSAEGKTFSIKKSCYKYSPILKSIKSKGICFPSSIEDLLAEEFWEIAKLNGWLVPRLPEFYEIDKKVLSYSNEEISKTVLLKNGFNETEVDTILFKIGNKFKKDFSQLVIKNSNKDLFPLKFLVEDILITLKLLPLG
ncbi:response regulator [Flagellimonas taeanensis]|uniref:Response regulator n=1 Tax=Flagellimonas iocasae TaxID=2055905 RepID=A0ABW4XZP4_9FLAO|nr:response regulator [Allomuricauda taeanensis]RIV51584.1 response regulator [Allomuricauda taeanensis]